MQGTPSHNLRGIRLHIYELAAHVSFPRVRSSPDGMQEAPSHSRRGLRLHYYELAAHVSPPLSFITGYHAGSAFTRSSRA